MRLLQLKITSLRKVKNGHPKKAHYLILTIHRSVISALQSDYYNQGHLEKADQSDYSKITINSAKVITTTTKENKQHGSKSTCRRVLLNPLKKACVSEGVR